MIVDKKRKQQQVIKHIISVLCPEESAEVVSVWWQDLACYLLREITHRFAPSVKSKCTRTTMTSRLTMMWHLCSSALLSTSLITSNQSALLITWRTNWSSTSATVSSQDGEAPTTKVGVNIDWFCRIIMKGMMMTFHAEELARHRMSAGFSDWFILTVKGEGITLQYVNLYLTLKSIGIKNVFFKEDLVKTSTKSLARFDVLL